MAEIEEQNRKAWTKAHNLETDIYYLLEEIKNNTYQTPNHMLGMVLKHIYRELKDIKKLIRTDPE